MAILIAFLALVGGVAFITAEQAAQQAAATTGTLDAAALPAAAQQWAPWIEQAGELCPQISAPLLAAQEEVESNFDPNAVSPSGAEGIAQFLPSTWPSWSQPPATTGPDTPYNAPDAIMAQGRFMCALAAQMAGLAATSGISVISLALAAYNAGSGAVIGCGCVPDNGQTAEYVAKVEALEASFTAVLTSTSGGIEFAKATVWQTDDIVASDGGSYDVSNRNVVAAITKDAADMQAAGVTWSRWWVGPGLTPTQVTTTVSIFRQHGISVDLDVNAGKNSDPGTEVTLEGWLGVVVPAVAALGDHFWEIGNEPNLSDYWDTCAGTDVAVASYLVRLRDASTTIRRFDPTAYISSAGISYNPSYTALCAITSAAWFRALDSTDAASLINCVGIHPYASSPGGVVAALKDTRSALTGGLAALPFCVTEVGFWSSGYASNQNGEVSPNENDRAADYTSLMNDLESYGISTPVFWYTWYDYNDPAGYGIVHYVNLTARTYLPIYSAVQAFNVPTAVLTSSSGGSNIGTKIVEAAASAEGLPYVWGGGNDQGPTVGQAGDPGGNPVTRQIGFDCSGLVKFAVFQASGGAIDLPHSSEQIATLGQAIAKTDLEPGDIIGFALEGGSDIDHDGVYIGDDEMIDAPDTGSVVRVDSLASSYWTSVPWVIRRFATAAPAPVVVSQSGGSAGVGTPLSCPAGAVHVSPGNMPATRPDTAYCFAAGTYSHFSAEPQDGDAFYGGGSAVLDGDGLASAFVNTGSVANMTIDGFRIEGYQSGQRSHTPGAIDLHNGSNVTISDNTIVDDATSGISMGAGAPNGDYTYGVSNSTITHNVIDHVGYSGTIVVGSTDDTVSYNDVTQTDQFGASHEDDVAAIGKFAVDDGTQIVGNYAHNNPAHGIWLDVFDNNNLIENNRVIDNNVSGIFIEEARTTLVEGNTADGNGFEDAHAQGNPGAGISVSSSGPVTVTGNTMTGNLINTVAAFVGHPGLPVDVIQSDNHIGG